jgi:hypothetical protein
MKKSIIKKSISRKLQTAKFESVDIFVEIEEEIDWETIEERMDKTKKISSILVLDFASTLDKVMEELKANKHMATIAIDSSKKVEGDQSKNTINIKEDELFDDSEKKEDDGDDFDILG